MGGSGNTDMAPPAAPMPMQERTRKHQELRQQELRIAELNTQL